MELLLVAAKKDMILGYAELIRDAGFNPMVIDVASFANQNAWEYLLNHQEEEFEDSADQAEAQDEEFGDEDEALVDEGGDVETVALLDVGGGVTNVHIVKDGVPLFTRDLPLGVTNFVEEFQKQLGLTYETAQRVARGDLEGVDAQLVTEIVHTVGSEIYDGLEPSLSYMKTAGESEGFDRIVLSGGGAHLPGLLAFLAERYGVPCEVADPLQALDYEPDLFAAGEAEELGPMLTVGVGLALREGV